MKNTHTHTLMQTHHNSSSRTSFGTWASALDKAFQPHLSSMSSSPKPCKDVCSRTTFTKQIRFTPTQPPANLASSARPNCSARSLARPARPACAARPARSDRPSRLLVLHARPPRPARSLAAVRYASPAQAHCPEPPASTMSIGHVR